MNAKTSQDVLQFIKQLPWNERLWLVTQVLQEMTQDESPAANRQPLRSLHGLWQGFTITEEDIAQARQGGAQEVVLTGVHLASWGQDFGSGARLQDLVEAVLAQSDVPRLRLSSLESWDLDEAFFSLWQDARL